MEEPVERWNENIQDDDEVVLLDTMNNDQLQRIGEWLEVQRKNAKQLFSVGSSGIEMALGNYWNHNGMAQQSGTWPAIVDASLMLVVSGSCSPVTSSQIQYAIENGFEELILDPDKISEDVTEVIQRVTKFLQNAKDVIVHTGAKRNGTLPSEVLGTALGRLAKEAVAKASVKRVVIAGGDTSSYAARAMEIEALEMIAPLVSGAPLCKAYSKNKSIDGMEVNLKGGQVGDRDYFMTIKAGSEIRTKIQESRSKK
jgi:3-oxoisoapionate kinase